MSLYCVPCEVAYHQRAEIAVSIIGGDAVCRNHFAALAAARDPEPQPSDGPDYDAEHAAWRRRRAR